jgi:molecular chaperone GrpE (heat shock protein)
VTSDEGAAALAGLIEAADVLARAERGVRRAMENKPTSAWRRWLAGDDSAAMTAVLDGIQLGRRRLERSLAKHGLIPIPAIGRPLDAEMMEVIEAVSSPSHPTGTVVEEVRVGYQQNGSVFRLAQVKVAR